MKEAIRLVRQSTLRFFQASPTEILQSVLASMQIRLQNDGISIKRTHEDVSTTVCITPELLSAVLGSLCNHALEYMQTSKQRTLEIHSYEKALWWVVEIKDSGRGIPLDQWKEVFGDTGSSGSDRLSLGAIRETLRLFEGEIAIKESIVGKGTTMLLRLKKI
jgi:C4-dicarboxylate-specific signal transduction histidine kinase